MIHLYIFCSRLEKHFQDTLVSELENWNVPEESSLKKTMWRSCRAVRKRRRTDAGNTTGSGNGEKGDNGEPMNADEFNDDFNWFMKVLEWRKKCQKEGAISTMA